MLIAGNNTADETDSMLMPPNDTEGEGKMNINKFNIKF